MWSFLVNHDPQISNISLSSSSSNSNFITIINQERASSHLCVGQGPIHEDFCGGFLSTGRKPWVFPIFHLSLSPSLYLVQRSEAQVGRSACAYAIQAFTAFLASRCSVKPWEIRSRECSTPRA